MTPAEIRELLARHGLRAHKSLGQNFLGDARVAEKIVREARVAKGDRVLEIGAGLGLLTRALAAAAGSVVAVELDAGLVRMLVAEGALPAGVRLVHGDALALDLGALLGEGDAPRRVVANLPYAVSSPLLRRLLDLAPHLAGWTVMVQREVAERLMAEPGGRAFGSLSVLHRLAADGERVMDVNPRCFFPVPAVVSTVLRFTPRANAPSPEVLAAVERLVRAGFGQRRKTLRRALRAALALPEPVLVEALGAAGVDPGARAETLAPEEWVALEVALRGVRRH